MQTMGYLWQIMRHPTYWRNPYGLLWVNTIPGRWLWHIGARCRWWHEFGGDRGWADRDYGGNVWRYLWATSWKWTCNVWRERTCRFMGHVAGKDEGYHLWCRRCKHDMRNTKELSGAGWWRQVGWNAMKGGCVIGAVAAGVYYGSWPLFKWLVRMAIE